MPLRLQNLLRDNLLRLGYHKEEMEKKLSNYFALCRTDQLRMALVIFWLENDWNLLKTSSYYRRHSSDVRHMTPWRASHSCMNTPRYIA